MNANDSPSLADVCEFIVDCEHKTALTQEIGYPSIRTPNIGRGRLLLDGVNQVSEETYSAWTRRATPRAGDLILAREAPAGNVAMVPEGTKVCLGQRTVLIRPNTAVVDADYLLYLLISDSVQQRLLSLSTGATVHHLNVADIRALQLPRPPSLESQHHIGSILSACDDLIENNKRRIAILEEMARSIYREWFEKFRFPGHERVRMAPSELGMVPEGWEVHLLRDVATVNSARLLARNPSDLIQYIDISSVSTGRIERVECMLFGAAPGRARRRVKEGDTIWSTVRPNRRSYSLILRPSPNLVVSTGFAVVSPRSVPYTYLYHAITTDAFADYLTSRAIGSAYPAVVATDFENAALVIPARELLERFHWAVADLMGQRQILLGKSIKLGQMRDLLLPRLVSEAIDMDRQHAIGIYASSDLE